MDFNNYWQLECCLDMIWQSAQTQVLHVVEILTCKKTLSTLVQSLTGSDQSTAGKILYLLWHCGWEQQCLSLLLEIWEDCSDVLLKPHVNHTISLVQTQVSVKNKINNCVGLFEKRYCLDKWTSDIFGFCFDMLVVGRYITLYILRLVYIHTWVCTHTVYTHTHVRAHAHKHTHAQSYQAHYIVM